MVRQHLRAARDRSATGTLTFKLRLNRGGVTDRVVGTEYQEK